ncbi:MAG: nitronate monooxygenase [Bacteroidetes bacterium]|nr:nitronate monooxygenase [Bacteroidota bacterium]
MQNRITALFGIRYPIIQGGMIWNSGWELASAVSNHGGLGLIGSGSMYPHILEEHIQKCKKATQKPFGVNLPLIYPQVNDHIDIIIKEGIKIVFSSAGNPAKWTPLFKEHGIKVVHVVANTKFAIKSEESGVDAIVAEGFEAGGHNGREETTTMCLVPLVKKVTTLPLIAAGGIGSGRAMAAAMALGADGVQVGSRFAASKESSGHTRFKERIIESKDGDTMLTLKELIPVRLLHNGFFEKVQQAYTRGASKEELQELLGRGRAKKGMFEGDLEEGELEIGQISALFDSIDSVEDIMKSFVSEYNTAISELQSTTL